MSLRCLEDILVFFGKEPRIFILVFLILGIWLILLNHMAFASIKSDCANFQLDSLSGNRWQCFDDKQVKYKYIKNKLLEYRIGF